MDWRRWQSQEEMPNKVNIVAEAFDLQILELKKHLKDRCLPDFFLGNKAPKEISLGPSSTITT